MSHHQPPQAPPGDRFLLGIVCGVLTFWLFAQSLVNIAPEIQKSMVISAESLNLAISCTALFAGCFIVAAGSLADRFGLIRFTLLGFILSIIGSLCLVLANGSVLLITGRIIQGLSAACIMPSTLALLKVHYHGRERQRALSFWSVGSWGGSGFCSLAGGAIATWLGWQWIFILSILCAVTGMILIRGVPERKTAPSDKAQAPDKTGIFLFVILLLSLNPLITKGSEWGLNSNFTIALLACCLLSVIFFWLTEKIRKSSAFIDFSLFHSRPYSGAVLSNFMMNTVAGTLLITNTYIQESRGFTSFQTGMLSVGYLVAVLAMIRAGEKILQRTGARKPMILGAALTGAGIALMSLTVLTDSLYIAAVMTGYILFGLGLGIYATPSTDTAISNTPAEKTGTASGVYKMASSLGGAFGIAISAAVYALIKTSGVPAESAAMITLMINTGFCLLSLLAVYTLVPATTGKHST